MICRRRPRRPNRSGASGPRPARPRGPEGRVLHGRGRGAILTYPRGDFFDGDPEDCGGFTGRAVQFDDVARADQQLIKAALAASGTPIERVGGRFLSDGRVRDAWFMSTHGAPFAASWSLEYDAEGTRSPVSAGMVTLTPVEGEQDWWFACCAD